MHEFAICENLVEAVLTEMKEIDSGTCRLVKVRVTVGALRQIVPENLTLAYAVMTHDTPAACSTLELESVPIVAVCKQCGEKGEISGALFLCNACGSRELELISGMELYLESMEIETDDE